MKKIPISFYTGIGCLVLIIITGFMQGPREWLEQIPTAWLAGIGILVMFLILIWAINFIKKDWNTW